MEADEYNKSLIEILVDEPCIYDPADPAFNNINERHMAYVRLGQRLRDRGANEEQVHRINDRFQVLKRRFLTEYRKVQRGLQSHWAYYEDLLPLLNSLAEKSATSETASCISEPNILFSPYSPCPSSDERPTEAKRRHVEEKSAACRTEFAGIFDYIAFRLDNMEDTIRKSTVEKILRLVHNPSMELMDERVNASTSTPKW
ncbi:unnamed protein product [Bursaphelenchus xylophilus]|uniref:(pine wood nematode) hypothetical protein n=1 Tax=Bursaphelenchus xylophilus TaxID=6326 RepID=A0A1I7RX32_BURXY|nr:unnamed protein product [Bursaphelenchus xylophilus]CAG9121291.1 unnamed protein product [Bursaphelenchus xylophilus]